MATFTDFAAHRIDQENRLNAWLCLQEVRGNVVTVVQAQELYNQHRPRGEKWFIPTDLGGGLVKNWCSEINSIDHNYVARSSDYSSYFIHAGTLIYVVHPKDAPRAVQIQTDFHLFDRVTFTGFDGPIFGTVQGVIRSTVHVKLDNGESRKIKNRKALHLVYDRPMPKSE